MFTKIVDMLIDRIILFTDYFIVTKHITLSESGLFFLSVARAIWFSMFGVNLGPAGGPLNHEAWTPIFWLVSLFHFAGFFSSNLIYRISVLCLYGFMWCFLGLLVLQTTVTSPAVPTFLIFSLMSVFIAIRLIKDYRRA